MGLLDFAKGVISNLIHADADWWVEVTTEEPSCIYYFGPFDHQQEAEAASPGYVEDLQNEGAQDIHAIVKRCKPEAITIVNGVKE